jgi:Flp pilus assembly pilin Flp
MIRYIVRRAAGAALDRKGVSAAEYAILAVGIVIVVGAAATAFKEPLKTAFTGIGGQIATTTTAVQSAP